MSVGLDGVRLNQRFFDGRVPVVNRGEVELREVAKGLLFGIPEEPENMESTIAQLEEEVVDRNLILKTVAVVIPVLTGLVAMICLCTGRMRDHSKTNLKALGVTGAFFVAMLGYLGLGAYDAQKTLQEQSRRLQECIDFAHDETLDGKIEDLEKQFVAGHLLTLDRDTINKQTAIRKLKEFKAHYSQFPRNNSAQIAALREG